MATYSESAHSPRDGVPEHLSTPSPDTSEYNSDDDNVEGSSVAEEDNDAVANDDDDEDDYEDEFDDDDDDDEMERQISGRADSAADRSQQVCTDCLCY